MCVDGDIAAGCLIQLQLLVGMCEVQLGEGLSSSQGRKEVVDKGKRIYICLRRLVYCELIVPTNSYGAIPLDDRNNGCCPFRKIYSLDDAVCFQLL